MRDASSWLRVLMLAACLSLMLLPTVGCSGDDDPDSDGDGVRDARDVDVDDDGLIEVASLTQLDWMRHDLAGASRHDGVVGSAEGCPVGGCIGYELTRSLDFDTRRDGVADAADRFHDYDGDGSQNGWRPIGTQAAPFTATFEGNGFALRNLFVDRRATDVETAGEGIGLFGFVAGDGALRNLRFEGGLTRLVGDRLVGALAGSTDGVRVENVHLDGAIEGRDEVGGLIGFMSGGEIVGASQSAESSVSGEAGVGGIVGAVEAPGDFSLRDCESHGDVTGLASVGGLVGSLASTNPLIAGDRVEIASSRASGDTHGAQQVGGIVGLLDGGVLANPSLLVFDVSSTGLVAGDRGGETATEDIGGIVGRAAWNVTVSDCLVEGSVQGDDSVGGVVGSMSDGVAIYDCVAEPAGVLGELRVGGVVGHATQSTWLAGNQVDTSVDGHSWVGGQVGLLDGGAFVSEGTSAGSVRGSGSYVGGLVGAAQDDAQVLFSSSSAVIGPRVGVAVQSNDYMGGLVGMARDAVLLHQSFATGDVEGRDFVGGAVGALDFVASEIGSGSQVSGVAAVGDVTGHDAVGGLIGLSYNAYVRDTFSTGSVDGHDRVGGLVGEASESEPGSTLQFNFSVSPLPGLDPPRRIGALVGYANEIHYEGNWWANDVPGPQTSALGGASDGILDPEGTSARSLAQLQLLTTAGATNGDAYYGWGAEWSFGTQIQLPGLVIGFEIVRDGDGDGALD